MEKGNTEMAISFGLVDGADVLMSNWNGGILGPHNVRLYGLIICPLCFVLLDCHNVDISQLFRCCNGSGDGSGVVEKAAGKGGREGIGIVGVERVLPRVGHAFSYSIELFALHLILNFFIATLRQSILEKMPCSQSAMRYVNQIDQPTTLLVRRHSTTADSMS